MLLLPERGGRVDARVGIAAASGRRSVSVEWVRLRGGAALDPGFGPLECRGDLGLGNLCSGRRPGREAPGSPCFHLGEDVSVEPAWRGSVGGFVVGTLRNVQRGLSLGLGGRGSRRSCSWRGATVDGPRALGTLHAEAACDRAPVIVLFLVMIFGGAEAAPPAVVLLGLRLRAFSC